MRHSRILFACLLLAALAGCAQSSAQGIDATSTLATSPVPPTRPAAAASTSPPTSTPAPIPDTGGWQTYQNAGYGLSFRFPSTWTLVEHPVELGVPGSRAPHPIVPMRNTLRLLIQYKRAAEEAVLGPGGRGKGEMVDRGTVDFFGQQTVRKALVSEGKVKSIFVGQSARDLLFYVQLDDLAGPGVGYGHIDLGEAVQAEFDRVIASLVRTQAASSCDAVGWPGYVVSNPPGAQFDDALVLLPEGAGRVGIAGSSPELEAEIVALRDRPEPGKLAHFWGTLSCDVPDVSGCQLLVTRLRYGASNTQPEPVEGWAGTLAGNPPGLQFDDYLVLSSPFGVAYGIHSLDAGLQTQLQALRDTGTPFRVWGVLRCGVPDAFGSQIEVTRIEQ